MHTALITGTSGFLGKYIVAGLRAQSFAIQTVGRHNADYTCDLSTAVPNLDQAPALVIHAAGKAHVVPKTPAEEQAFYTVNLQGTKNLCAAFDKLGIWPEAFVFISTVAVYGVEAGENITEQHPLAGTTPYAKSKIAAEQFLASWCSQYKVRLSILRLPLIAGVNPPGNLGDMIQGIQRGRYFNIGNGAARKSIVMASDVAKWVAAIAKVGGTYNLTDGDHPSFAALAKFIADQLGKKTPGSIPIWMAKAIALVGDVVGSQAPINTHKLHKITATLIFDDSKAKKAFGWAPAKVLNAFTIN